MTKRDDHMDETTMRKRARSRVFLSMKTRKEIAKERKRILRKYGKHRRRLQEPYTQKELDERYLLIRALKGRGDLRSGFDIIREDDGSYNVVETLRTTKRRIL